MPMKIAIAGKKFAGKSTLASRISEKFRIPRGSFAAALKDGCRRLGVEVEGPNKEVEVLQNIGVYLRETLGEDHWVDTLIASHPDLATTGLVVDDMRFPNEFQRLKDLGFLMVRLEIDRKEQIRRAEAMGAKLGDLDHASETALDDLPPDAWDMVTTTVGRKTDAVLVEILAAYMRRGFESLRADDITLPPLP